MTTSQKTLSKSLLIVMTILVSSSVFANTSKKQSRPVSRQAQVKKSTVKAPAIRQQGEYQTNMAFDGTQVNGRLAEGSLRKIVVENDKSLDDLLGVRKKFDDRVQEESQRNASW